MLLLQFIVPLAPASSPDQALHRCSVITASEPPRLSWDGILAVGVRHLRYRLKVPLWGMRDEYWDLGCFPGETKGDQRRGSQARLEAA